MCPALGRASRHGRGQDHAGALAEFRGEFRGHDTYIDNLGKIQYGFAMARRARLVVPGLPHHVTQRGNRRQQTFFCREDYAAYVDLMAEWCAKRGVDIWAYCLMPNHVHLIAVPQSEDALARAVGEAHRRYTRRVHFRENWRGYLWQGRFASFVMDEPRLLAAARYVELNPVRAKLVADAAEWPWSSAGPHLSGRDDRLVRVAPLRAMVNDWRTLLDSATGEEQWQALRTHSRTGRPLGNAAFVERLEKAAGRLLNPRKRGRKPKLLKQPN